MDPERSQLIIDALERKGVDQPCPRCGHTQFDAVAEAKLRIDEPPYRAVLGTSDDRLPIVLIACRRCGFLSQHALGRLLDFTAERDTEDKNEPAAQPA